jgi:hypothetical protein
MQQVARAADDLLAGATGITLSSTAMAGRSRCDPLKAKRRCQRPRAERLIDWYAGTPWPTRCPARSSSCRRCMRTTMGPRRINYASLPAALVRRRTARLLCGARPQRPAARLHLIMRKIRPPLSSQAAQQATKCVEASRCDLSKGRIVCRLTA